MRTSRFSLSAILIATAASCVAPELLVPERERELTLIYPEQPSGIVSFFAEEASRAGVRQIRAMTVGETPKKWSVRQSGCAQALFEERLVLVNTSRGRCLDLDHLAHEIAHIGVLRTHCFGHGDRFYDYNRGIAERFENTFVNVNERGGWLDPVGSVKRRAERYRVGAERCL